MKNGALNDLIASINCEIEKDIHIMEVCGTHTQVIAKAGLSEMLSPHIKLISGPGCPVCVTPEGYIDAAIELMQQPNTIIATFGDLIRVKGSRQSLEDCMEMKSRIRVIYSPFSVLDIAAEHSDCEVIFLAVGFETTAPLIAAAVKLSLQKGLRNLSFLVGLKRMPPVLEKVLSSQDMNLDALICPGHVSVIMGAEYFNFVSLKYEMPAVVCGFENSDVLNSILYLTAQIKMGRNGFTNLYTRCVRPGGNIIAKECIRELFEIKEGYWRGIGIIDYSEFGFRKQFATLDAVQRFQVKVNTSESTANCQCGAVIIGSKTPMQCSLFGKGCTYAKPMGPCMVSSEGACAIYYKYKRWEAK